MREQLNAMLDGVVGDAAVEEAKDIPQARQLIAKLQPDVVILDLRLPSGSGLELLKEIKKSKPETTVIMLTAFPDRYIEKECKKAGADFFFSKFNDFERAVGVVRSVIAKRAT
jgi:DNA-binding NarL/FixJ family response regulator